MITAMTVEEIARAIGGRELSPLEVVDAYLERIEREDARLASFTNVLADRARARAGELADDLAAGRPTGPLSGVPYAVKDMVAIAGVPMRAGSRLPALVPTADAPLVTTLHDAGAILVGTTGMFELALAASEAEVDDDWVGPRNPWDLSRTAGGSSSGSASAAAAGLVPFTVGTDTGGSIRIPAAFCGAVGYKPVVGALNGRGVLPLSWTLDTPGFFTRTVADVIAVLDAVPGSVATARDSAPRGSAPPTIGVVQVDADEVERLEPVVLDEVERCVELLARTGSTVRRLEFRLKREWQTALSTLVSYEGYRSHANRYDSSPELVGRYVAERFEHGAGLREQAYRQALEVREQARREFAEAFSDVDVLVLPSVPFPAPTVAEVRAVGARVHADFTRPINLADLPAISVPSTVTAEGLPVGVQLVSAPGADRTLLDAARALEGERGDLPAWQAPATTA